MRSVLLVLLLALSIGVRADAPAPAVQAEIDHLLDYLSASGCDFNRNGTWYEAKKARQHLEKKQAYLVQHGMIGTAEDFIARAASESSISGEGYLVRCKPAAPVSSRAWFDAELARYRAARGSSHH